MPKPGLVLAVLLSTTGFAVEAAAQARVLFLTKSAGQVHPVVQRAERGQRAFAEHQLRSFAAPQFEVDCTQDSGTIRADNLERYAAVVFYTSGELPIDAEGLRALFGFVEKGGGFVGIHSATDTLHKSPEYGRMIGGYLAGHPWNEKVGILVEDPSHPSMALLGDRFTIHDEIYQFRDLDEKRVRVLMRLDPSLPTIARGKHDQPHRYPLAWCRDQGAGRVFYTALGHRPEVWRDRRFLEHLTAGIRWAMGSKSRLSTPPKAATQLFDGDDLDAWTHADGKSAPGFAVADGIMTCRKGSGSIITRRDFKDFRLHLEFRIPAMPGEKGQARGNSGVYIQRRYEVQILDSFGQPPTKNGCASIYRQKAADACVSRAPGEWQSYDIWFRAARFSEPTAEHKATKTAKARITVIHNDVMVHDDVEIQTKTGAGRPEGPTDGPILLQDHGNPVSFRNVWILPTAAK